MNTSTVPSKNGDYGVCRTICDIHNLGLSSLRSYHSFIRFFSMAEVFAYVFHLGIDHHILCIM